MSASDLIKGNKTVIVAVLAAVFVIVAYLFIGQSGQESEPEEVISKRVRLEVVEEPASSQTEDQTIAEPQGTIGVPEPEAAADQPATEKPAAAAQIPSAVKDARKAPVAAKPVLPDEREERAPIVKQRVSKDELNEASPSRYDSEKRAVEKKPAKTAVKVKKERVDSEGEDADSKKVVKKQVTKAPKAAKAVTARDIKARPWVVGLASFKTLGEAQEVTGSLKALHHNAYITETVKDGRKWYRVRVGFYETREDAEKVGQSLSARFGLKNLWVVKPSKDEARAHFK